VEEYWSMKLWFRKLLKFNSSVKNHFSVLKRVSNTILLVLLFFLILPLKTQAYLQFDQNCILAYQKIWNLELAQAGKLIHSEKISNPNNNIPVLLENYIGFLRVFTHDTAPEYEQFKSLCSQNLEILNKEESTNSPLLLFSKAQIHLQSALIRVKYQDYWSATFELRKAYTLLEKNNQLFPGFILNPLYIGIIESLLGNLPPNLKFILGPMGLKGNVNEGLSKIESNFTRLKTGSFNFYYPEQAFYYTFLCSNLAPGRKSYTELIQLNEPVSDKSQFKIYINALLAIKKYQNDNAITILRSKMEGNEYAPFPFLDYLTGQVYLNRLDLNCIPYFESYLKNGPSAVNKKDTHLRIGWAYVLSGKDELAKKQFSECLIKTNEPLSEKDKQAMKEAERGIPNKSLLKARLLFDGGYFDSSLEILTRLDSIQLKTSREKLEYTYRKGRILEAKGKYAESIFFYKKTLDQGRNEPYYFAANSCLHLGLIAETQKNLKLAKQYYQNCLEMDEKEYKGSIDLEAQNGLNRIK